MKKRLITQAKRLLSITLVVFVFMQIILGALAFAGENSESASDSMVAGAINPLHDDEGLLGEFGVAGAAGTAGMAGGADDAAGAINAAAAADASLMQTMFSPQMLSASSDIPYSKISAAQSCAFAIKIDGSLWGWGANWAGQLGDGTDYMRVYPAKIMDGVIDVAAGGIHTLALKSDGSLWAWGANDFGEIGDGTTRDSKIQKKSWTAS